MAAARDLPLRCASRVLCDDCRTRGYAICGALAPHELPQLAAIASTRRLERGQVLFYEADPASDVFTVTDGTLKLFKLMSDGRRQITGFLLSGDFVGLAFGDAYVYSAEAVTPVTVCRFPRREFLRVLEAHPALEKELLSRASTEIAGAQEQMLLLGRKTARERVASFLVRLRARGGAAPGAALDLPMSRTDIADYLGLTIETVSRTFTSLKREGLIGLPDKHRVVIANAQRLEQAAGH
jgi:CRP/FNR family transcriptional regulator